MAVRSTVDNPPPSGPTLEQLAELLDTADGICHHPSATTTVRWLVCQSDLAQRHSELLEQWAEDAGLGFEKGAAYEAFKLHQSLQHLLSSTGWQWPEELLDPMGDRGVELGELLGLCRALRARDGDNVERLEIVEQRLVRAEDRRRRLLTARRRFRRQS